MGRAARDLKRRMVERALDSKVVAKIGPQPAPTHADIQTQPSTQRLKFPISEEQLNLLMNAQAQVQAAQQGVTMALRTVLAQHHVVNGSVVEIAPGRPAKIVVEVPIEPGTRKKGGRR